MNWYTPAHTSLIAQSGNGQSIVAAAEVVGRITRFGAAEIRPG